MYGRTVDDFEYRGVEFRWVISPNRLIYRVYHGSDLIGTIPVSQVRLRHSPEAIKALYPFCDRWIEAEFAQDAFCAAERLLDKAEETAIDMTRHPELHSLTGIEDLIAVPRKEERKEPKRRGLPRK